MKRIIPLLLLMCVTLTVSAQYWERYHEEADELKGTPAKNSYIANIPDVGLVVVYDGQERMGFVTFKGLFDYKPYKYYTVANGIFGMYDEKGILVEKANIKISVQEDSPHCGNAYLNPDFDNESLSGTKKVISWIRNNKGSVRIVIPKYCDSDFDVKVPTFQSQILATKSKTNRATQRKGTKSTAKKK